VQRVGPFIIDCHAGILHESNSGRV
jgi:hypothetical protein